MGGGVGEGRGGGGALLAAGWCGDVNREWMGLGYGVLIAHLV
jgi:hypothetical protein